MSLGLSVPIAMHELSLAENAIEIIEAAARRERFTRVHRIHIEIGVLSCVEPEALRFAIEASSMGTCAEGAAIDLVMVPGEGECPGCGLRAAAEEAWTLCPGCGRHALGLVQGTGMRITDLDVE